MDHRLRYPLSVTAFYLERTRKDILNEALICMLDCLLEDAIFDAKNGNPHGQIETQDISILKKALDHVRKLRQE